jgi:hypothetical protein
VLQQRLEWDLRGCGETTLPLMRRVERLSGGEIMRKAALSDRRMGGLAATAMTAALMLWALPAKGAVVTGNPGGACIPVPADYNGDGATDFSQLCSGAWFFYSPSGALIKGIWIGNVPGDRPIPADYDGDGDDDVVIWRKGAYLFYDYVTGQPTSQVWIGDHGNCVPIPGDFDGDGRADLSQQCRGAWFFYRANGTFMKAYWVGDVAGQIPVPGDYQGVGHDQMVIFRNGVWQFWNFDTGAGEAGIWTMLGIPAPLDTDGDGDLDFTVYDPGGAWFFFNEAGVAYDSVWTGGAPGDIPISRRIIP